MNTIIREWNKEDVSRILEIENAVHVAPWDTDAFSMCMRQDFKGYVLIEKANSEEKIVGFIILSFFPEECHILNLAVDLSHQRQGVGKALLNHVLIIARKNYHAKVAYLEVRQSNTRAIKLYSSFHFEKVGVRKNYYLGPHEPEDALIFAKVLTD